MLNYVRHFSKSGQFSTPVISETKSVTPNLFCISDTGYSLSECSKKKIEKSVNCTIFARMRPHERSTQKSEKCIFLWQFSEKAKQIE